MRGDLLLVEEYWLLTTGAQIVLEPSTPALLGTAMAIIRDLERCGEVTWRGHGADAVLQVAGPCRCRPPLRTWHDALVDYAGSEGSLPARFCLDAIMEDAWRETADHLVSRTLALVYRNRLTPDLYGVVDTTSIRRRREALLDLLPAGDHFPDRALDLLLVAHASQSLGDLLRAPGTPIPGSLLSVVGATVRRAHGDFRRYRETVTYRDANGWAYGPAALRITAADDEPLDPFDP